MQKENFGIQEKDDMGKKGEEMACAYLTDKGYSILDTNWHHGHKEVDIVARYQKEIVVVEVKTRAENYAEEPWEAVTPSKIRNIVEVADVWLRQNKVDLETRFDVISILLKKDGSHTLEHFEGAFIPPVN
jgi:putative endonuclease